MLNISTLPRYNKIKERSESMTAEEIEEIMRKKIFESFQVSYENFVNSRFANV